MDSSASTRNYYNSVLKQNRRIRNRSYGGVGGRREQSRLLPDPTERKNGFVGGSVESKGPAE